MDRVNKGKGTQVVVACASIITAFGFVAATVFKYGLAIVSLGAGTAIWILAVLLAYKGKRFWPDICITVVGAVLSLGLLIGQIKSYNDLSEAVGRGDIDRIKALISKGYDVNAHTGGGQNMLTWAFWYPYPNKTIWSDQPLKIMSPEVREKRIKEILAILIDAGADPNKLDPHGQSPLDYAVSHGQKEIVKMLLKRSADVNLKNGRGDTPLIVAVEANDIGVATLLIQGGADINAKDSQGKTALQIAVERGFPLTRE